MGMYLVWTYNGYVLILVGAYNWYVFSRGIQWVWI